MLARAQRLEIGNAVDAENNGLAVDRAPAGIAAEPAGPPGAEAGPAADVQKFPARRCVWPPTRWGFFYNSMRGVGTFCALEPVSSAR